MRTYLILLLLGCCVPILGQPLADFSHLKSGEQVMVEVSTRYKEPQRNFNNQVIGIRPRKTVFTYRLQLTSTKSGYSTFEASIIRVRDQYEYVPNSGNSDLTKSPQAFYPSYPKTYDTEFSTSVDELEDLRNILELSFLVSIYPEKEDHKIHLTEEQEKLFDACEEMGLEVRKMSEHICSIFFAQRYPSAEGTVESKLLSRRNMQRVILKGKIEAAPGTQLRITPKANHVLFRSPEDSILSIDHEGNFSGELWLDEARIFYLYFRGIPPAQSEEDHFFFTKYAFAMHIEPDEEEISFRMHADDPASLTFYGNNAEKHNSFQDFARMFFGNRRGNYQEYINPDPFGPEYFNNRNGTLRRMPALSPENLQLRYDTVMAFLEQNKSRLGTSCYYTLKAETVFGFASQKLRHDSLEIYAYDLKYYDLKGFTLSRNMGHFLDSMDLRLAEVKNSYGYPNFLQKHFLANLDELRKKNSEIPVRGSKRYLGEYYFAHLLYEGFPLLTLLKGKLVQDLIPSDYSIISEQVRKGAIEEYRSICSHQAYLDELEKAIHAYDHINKGAIAPNLILSDSVQLKDFEGKKVVLILFNGLGEKDYEFFEGQERRFPDFTFIYAGTGAIPGEYQRKSWQPGSKIKNLFHLPGFHHDTERPYHNMYSGFSVYCINQDGVIHNDFRGTTAYSKFVRDLEDLYAYNPNVFSRFFNTYRTQIDYVLWTANILFVLFGLIYIFYILPRRKRLVKQKERVETELKAIRAQMNPHFLFNSLTSVQNLINQSDRKQANHYLTRFSQLVRKVLNHSEQALIPLEDELKVVDLYCELEALRFRFEYKIEVDPEIDVYNTEVPSMLIQPYVENSVRHGLAMQAGKGHIGISVRKLSEMIRVEIDDNGIGIRQHQKEFAGKLEKSGFGLRLSDERIQKINERYKMDIEILIQDKRDDEEPSQGTRVVIEMPVEG